MYQLHIYAVAPHPEAVVLDSDLVFEKPAENSEFIVML